MIKLSMYRVIKRSHLPYVAPHRWPTSHSLSPGISRKFPIIGNPLGPGGYGNFTPLYLLLQARRRQAHDKATIIAAASVKEPNIGGMRKKALLPSTDIYTGCPTITVH